MNRMHRFWLNCRAPLMAAAIIALPHMAVRGQTIPAERLSDIAKGADSSNPNNFTLIDTRLFFTAVNNHGQHGLYMKNLANPDGTPNTDLWTTRGQEPKLLKTFKLPSGIRDMDEFTATETFQKPATGKVYFHVPDSGLWMTYGKTPLLLGRFDNTKDFAADEVTGMIAVQASGTAPMVYFGGWAAKTGQELYRSGGTGKTTKLVEDIVTGTGSSSPNELTTLTDSGTSTVFFRMTPAGSHTPQIWTTTTNDLTAASPLVATSGSPSQLLASPDIQGCYFVMPTTNSNGVPELWSTPATPGSAVVLTSSGTNPLYLTESSLDGSVLFSGNDSVNGRQLWLANSYNGANLVDILNPNGNANPYNLTDGVNYFYYAATAPDANDENYVFLFQTDGGAGDSVAIDYQGSDGNTYYPTDPTEITPVVDDLGDAMLYFVANGYVDDGNGVNFHDAVLWMLPDDGSTQDAVPVLDGNGNIVTGATNLTAVVSDSLGIYELFFARNGDDGYGTEVWVTQNPN